MRLWFREIVDARDMLVARETDLNSLEFMEGIQKVDGGRTQTGAECLQAAVTSPGNIWYAFKKARN